MLTKEAIREIALNAGADLCGFGDLARFEGAPKDMDPRYVFPDAKTLICLAFRMPRGVQRGIEEGTQFYQYPSLAYGGINETFAPAVLYEVGKFIEDHGYEAMLYRNTGARGRVSDMNGEEGNTLSPEEQIVYQISSKHTSHHRSVQYTRAVSDDKAAPDLQFQFRIAAVACGLGEIGWSKMLLTPEFGPMQRVAFIFTDAPLEPDPMYNGEPLCKRCMACVRECPGGCISKDEAVRIAVGGKVLEWGKLDEWRCYIYYTYSGRKQDPFVPTSVFEEHKDGKLRIYENKDIKATEQEVLNVYSVLDPYFPTWTGYNMAKCGGCIGACVNMLEKTGCLKGKFKAPFRTGKRRWQIDR
jgi:epoxyqueuosine reductase